AALNTEQVVQDGVRGKADIRAIASRGEHGIQVMVWNYHDDEVPVKPASIELTIDGLPAETQQALVEHFRIDSEHSNAFAAWEEMGSPQSPTPDQYKQLESAGQLQLLTSPRWIQIDHGIVHVKLELPRQAVSL